MEALVWEAPGRMAMGDWPEPVAAAGEVVIEVAYAGICGSDLGGYLGHNALRVPPLVMGHEFSGTIVALGENVADLAIGSQVTCNPMLFCDACVQCRAGLPHLCANRRLVGAHLPGAFANRVSVPRRAVFELPAGTDLRAGALVEPVAVGMHIGTLAGDMTGKTGLVIGAGPVGLLALQALLRQGAASVLVSDIDTNRLAMASTMGGLAVDASRENLSDPVRRRIDGGVDVSVDAVGSAQTRGQAVAATRPAGFVLLSGLHEEASTFPASDVIRREITVRGAFCYSPDNFAAALEAVADGSMRLDPWIIEAPLSEGGAWFERLTNRPGNVSKVLLVP